MKLPESAPNLTCGLLRIWVMGREFPDSTDYWDGNWLRVVTAVSDRGASVAVSGPILHLGEIVSWRDELIRFDKTLKGKARLTPLEPNLSIELTCDRLGHVEAECFITPDHLTQSHSFTFDFDQSCLKSLIRECDTILHEFPIRGTP